MIYFMWFKAYSFIAVCNGWQGVWKSNYEHVVNNCILCLYCEMGNDLQEQFELYCIWTNSICLNKFCLNMNGKATIYSQPDAISPPLAMNQRERRLPVPCWAVLLAGSILLRELEELLKLVTLYLASLGLHIGLDVSKLQNGSNVSKTTK